MSYSFQIKSGYYPSKSAQYLLYKLSESSKVVWLPAAIIEPLPPDVALNMAKLYGIKVYTIGVGSNTNRIDDNHHPLSNGNSSPLDFNEGLLKQLAAETGGQYYYATDNAALQNIYKSIDRLEKSNISVTTYKRYTEQFQWFVLVAVVLVVLEVLLRLTVLRKFP